MLSQVEYARHRGLTRGAISNAIAKGRLKDSLVYRNGKPKIRSIAEADEEWDKTTVRIPPKKDSETETPKRNRVSSDPIDGETSLIDERRRLIILQQEKIQEEIETKRIENAVRRGELIEKAQAVIDITNTLSGVRSRILQLPSQLAQRVGGISDHMRDELEAIIYDALEELGQS